MDLPPLELLHEVSCWFSVGILDSAVCYQYLAMQNSQGTDTEHQPLQAIKILIFTFVLCSHAYCVTVQRLLLTERHSYKCSHTTLTEPEDQEGDSHLRHVP